MLGGNSSLLGAQNTIAHQFNRIDGVTFLSFDEARSRSPFRALLIATVAHVLLLDQGPRTLISLLRTYSSLDSETTPDGATTLPFPSRIAYPRIPYFSDKQPVWDGEGTDELIPRTLSDLGIPRSLTKSLLPSTGIMYQRDFLDLHESVVPFVFERVVIADHEAATKASSKDDLPYWSTPFRDLTASKNWWEPVRSGISRTMRVPENSDEVVVTYISRQDVESGPTLKPEDHDILVKELESLARDTKCTVNIVSYSAPWQDKLSSILRSTVRTPSCCSMSRISFARSLLGCIGSLWRSFI